MFKFFQNRNRPTQHISDGDEEMTDGVADDVRFGPVLIPKSEVVQHIAFIGTTGSGKTTSLRLFMQDALPQICPGSDQRALVYDAKQEFLPILLGMDPNLRVVTSHPFDVRGAAWDIAKDAKSPAIIAELAITLIPASHESQPYFTNAARHLLLGVMLSFFVRRLNWSFADLLRSFTSPDLLRRILGACRYTKHLEVRYCSDKKLLDDILSTVATKMMEFEPLAAAWEHATSKFSIEQWVKEEFVLVLGNYETGKHAINTINRCIFKRACDVTLNLPNSSSRRTYFILDELSEMGRLSSLISLLKKGRSKGASVALAFQSVSGLQDKTLYGPQLTEEILDQIGYFAIGRVGPSTAQWCSKLIGDEEISQITVNKTDGPGGHSTSHNESIVKRAAVLPSEFQNIAPCGLEYGLTAFYKLRTEPCAFLTTMDGYDLFENDLLPPDENVRDFEPRHWQCELLEPWTPEQIDIFAPPTSSEGQKDRATGPESASHSLLDRMEEL